MKSLRRFLAGSLLALFAAAASGHPFHGDGPPIPKEELPTLGQHTMKLLVEAKQLAPSWQGRPTKDVRSEQTPSGPVWILSYENPAEADRTKRAVYLFFDEFGNFIGGNHSGKLQ